jgi:nitrite reductase/ring-hydroxylating ferredoxin subunit
MGELLRRYWHPIALSKSLGDLPKRVTILGEELVLFRDRQGRAGLLYPRCMHRGTSLYYGKVEDRGIRCCYHGWLFDVQGRCLEQPCEPRGGKDLDRVRQPWYPVEERYGFVFAFLGPAEKEPVLPRYDILENLGDDEALWCTLGGFGSTGDGSLDVVSYSWLHMNDNVMDPWHVHVLHSTLTGPQFAAEFALLPEVRYFESDYGVCYSAVRELPDGRRLDRVSSWFMPNVMSVPDILEARPIVVDLMGSAGRRQPLRASVRDEATEGTVVRRHPAERQALGRDDARGAPADAGRLRGAVRPRADLAALRGASAHERSRHHDAAPHAEAQHRDRCYGR